MTKKFVSESCEHREFIGIMLISGKFVSEPVTFDALTGYSEVKSWIIK